MTFREPDFERYPCLRLAMQASLSGQAATTCLNASNEVAVDAFLNNRISYLDIAKVVEETLNQMPYATLSSIDEILQTDAKSREVALKIVETLAC